MNSIIRIDKDTIKVDKRLYKKVVNTYVKRAKHSPNFVYIKWDDNYVSTLGELIATTRKKQHLTQKELAIKIGKATQYVNLIEHSKPASYDTIIAVLKELNLIIGVE